MSVDQAMLGMLPVLPQFNFEKVKMWCIKYSCMTVTWRALRWLPKCIRISKKLIMNVLCCGQMIVVDLSSPERPIRSIVQVNGDNGADYAGAVHRSPKIKKSALKALSPKEIRQLKKAKFDSAKIKMLIDLAKLETSLKDCIEKDFFDVSIDTDGGILPDQRGYFANKCEVAGLIRWTHISNDTLARNGVIPSSEVEPFALIVANCEEFLEMILKSADGIDFEHLGAYIDSTRSVMTRQELCPAQSSLILLLLDLDKHILKAQKKEQKVR